MSRWQPQDFIVIIDMLMRVCSVYVGVDACENSCLPAGRRATDIYSLIETNIIWSPNNEIASLTSSSTHTHTTNSFSKHLPWVALRPWIVLTLAKKRRHLFSIQIFLIYYQIISGMSHIWIVEDIAENFDYEK